MSWSLYLKVFLLMLAILFSMIERFVISLHYAGLRFVAYFLILLSIQCISTNYNRNVDPELTYCLKK